MTLKNKPSVLILGGAVNSLSLMRSFGRLGIQVSACMGPHPALYSRYCHRSYLIPADIDGANYYSDLLLSNKHPELNGSVIFSCGDDAVEFVARNYHSLSKNYLLENNIPELQLQLLDKQNTLELARKAGVPTPAFYHIERRDDLENALQQIPYPAMLKPRNTHAFKRQYGTKYLLAQNEQELLNKGGELISKGISFMVCEMIPGPDSRSCSYYTYRTLKGSELMHLTKRCVRRFPTNEGSGTYQITDHLEDVEQLGRRFFDSLNYRGIGNLEFKRDERDQQLKVIECNNRFTAVQEQLVQSGVDAALFAYCDITGEPLPEFKGCESHVAIWSPLADMRAMRQIKHQTGGSWLDWLRQMPHKKLVFPYFNWHDLRPFFKAVGRDLNIFTHNKFPRLCTLFKKPALKAKDLSNNEPKSCSKHPD